MGKRIYTLLELYRKPRKNKILGITYEIIYIPPELLKQLKNE